MPDSIASAPMKLHTALGEAVWRVRSLWASGDRAGQYGHHQDDGAKQFGQRGEPEPPTDPLA